MCCRHDTVLLNVPGGQPVLFARICLEEGGEKVTYVAFREAYNLLVAPASRQTFSANTSKGAKAGERAFNIY